jgi:ubiquinone biosynthesis UbiH/UbiF/VisC/COQ6 family hydroxylase
VALIDNMPFTAWQSNDDYGLRVSAINLASIELLEKIGVWEDIRSMRACPYQTMHVWEQQSDTQIHFSSDDTSHSMLGAIVENHILLTGLNNKVDQCVNIQRFNQHRLEHLSAISSSAMLLELDDSQRLSAQLVLGADGQRSKVRECIGVSQLSTQYQQHGLVCTVNTEMDHQQTAWQCFTPDGPLALLPLDEHVCSTVWSVAEEKCQELISLSDEEFNHQITHAFESKLGRLSICSERRSFPLRGAQASQYIDHRVVLLGDAAHVVHPLAGLGLNLGLADVQVLSDLLQTSDRPLGSQRVLRQYERARKSENRLMQKSLEMIDALFREQRTFAKQARSIGVNMTDKFLPIKLMCMRHALGVPI